MNPHIWFKLLQFFTAITAVINVFTQPLRQGFDVTQCYSLNGRQQAATFSFSLDRCLHMNKHQREYYRDTLLFKGKWFKDKSKQPHPLFELGSLIPFILDNTHYYELISSHNIYHHHLVVPTARISLTLDRHSSLSFIASGWSSELHPAFLQSHCM